jgi:hypothetical protein
MLKGLECNVLRAALQSFNVAPSDLESFGNHSSDWHFKPTA